ncbi:MAG TPA: ABC transporter ATP-binding protein [Bauldia sp.]|nr:ABC transporter ATP-binding protein [Bauldia sp.]
MTAVPALELVGVTKRYGAATAVDNLDLQVAPGEFLTLLGPSGSGKTTILKIIAGFEQADRGEARIDGRDVSVLSPGERQIGVVFQHYALFPHMTVAGNIAYPLRRRRWPRPRVDVRVAEMLRLVRLEAFADRYPRQLSGGQQQRVALARALAFGPKLLLMDEPLGALDRTLRLEMEEEIRRIHREAGASVLYVTHDQEEALTLSDRIAVMRNARILQAGRPRDLYERPNGTFVAQFFGDCNLLPVEEVLGRAANSARVRVFGQDVSIPASCSPDKIGVANAAVVVRPQLLSIGAIPAQVTVPAVVRELLYLGNAIRLTCELAQARTLIASVPAQGAGETKVGDTITLSWDPAAAVLVLADGTATTVDKETP